MCGAILGGIRKVVHLSLSKSRRLLGERQESAYKHDAQASEFSGTLACASCLYWGQTFICRSPYSFRVDNNPFIRFHPEMRCTLAHESPVHRAFAEGALVREKIQSRAFRIQQWPRITSAFTGDSADSRLSSDDWVCRDHRSRYDWVVRDAVAGMTCLGAIGFDWIAIGLGGVSWLISWPRKKLIKKQLPIGR